MTLAEALQKIKDNRNSLDYIVDGTDPNAKFIRTSDTFVDDSLVSDLREALWIVTVAIHEDEIQITP